MDNAEKKELMSVIDSGWYTESTKTKESTTCEELQPSLI